MVCLISGQDVYYQDEIQQLQKQQKCSKIEIKSINEVE